MKITDEYEPTEEGLDNVTIERYLAVLEVTLSTKEPEDKTIGYQPPIPEEEVVEQAPRRPRRSQFNNRRNGRRNNRNNDLKNSRNRSYSDN